MLNKTSDNNPFVEMEARIDKLFEQYDSIKSPALREEIVEVCANELDLNLINVKAYLPMFFDAYTKTIIKILLRDGKVRIKNLGTFYLVKYSTKKFKGEHYVLTSRDNPSVSNDKYGAPGIRMCFKPSTTLRYNIYKLFKDDKEICDSMHTISSDVEDINKQWKIDKEQSWYIQISKILDIKYKGGESLMWIINQDATNLLKPHRKYNTVRKFIKRTNERKAFSTKIAKHLEGRGIKQFKG